MQNLFKATRVALMQWAALRYASNCALLCLALLMSIEIYGLTADAWVPRTPLNHSAQFLDLWIRASTAGQSQQESCLYPEWFSLKPENQIADIGLRVQLADSWDMCSDQDIAIVAKVVMRLLIEQPSRIHSSALLQDFSWEIIYQHYLRRGYEPRWAEFEADDWLIELSDSYLASQN